jgi:DNA-binding XRE family transcriptional regulator
MNIGDNLRVLRNKQNISQQMVADFLGVDRKTYVSWESGTADIKSSYIPRLAELMQVEINDLFRKKVNNIIIAQHNPDSKEFSANNSVVLLLTDKEAVEQLVDIIKKKAVIP